MAVMETHPYRTPSSLDDSHPSGTRAPDCFVCRMRARLAGTPRRVYAAWFLALAFAAVNVATVALARSSLREAKHALAEARSTRRAAKAALDRAERKERTAPTPPSTPADLPMLLPSPTPPQRATRSLPGDGWRGIVRVSDTEFYVDSGIFARMEDEDSLGTRVRVVPEQADGKVIGVKVFGVTPGSLLQKLGFKNGDAVESVNGYDLSRPDSALEAYARLRGASELAVRLERHGKPLELRYHLRSFE